MKTILITGSRSGLGLALMKAFDDGENDVIGFDIKDGHDVLKPHLMNRDIPRLDILINCAAVNKINWLEDVSEAEWDHVVGVNAKGIFMMTKALLPQLTQSKGTVVNIVSDAAHRPMTCSLAYNASKGAAHIMTLQLARELTKTRGITVFGVAPNKMEETGMSHDIDEQVCKTRGWTMEQAKAYQKAGLLTGEETPPELVAEFIEFLLSTKERHKHLSGCVIPYGC